MRCAIYARVSNEEKENKWVSIENQIYEAKNYIKNKWYTLNENLHIFCDNWYSGANDDRPALNKLMYCASKNEFDLVLVWKVDRFFRKTLHLLEYVEFLTQYGVLFKSLTQEFETTTSSGKMILWIFWVIWELERDLIRERTSAWKLTKSRKWYYVWGWKPTLWYDFYNDWIWIKLKINKEEAELVKEIYKLYVEDKNSLWDICRILESRGEKTKDDRLKEKWKKTKKVVAWVWQPTIISRLIKNEMYTWYYYYGKTEKVKDPITWKYITKNVSKDKLTPLTCPKIIDLDTYNKAQVLLVKNKQTKNHAKNHTFAWLIKCDNCWMSYVWYKATKWTLNYRCKWSMKKSTLVDKKCDNHNISEIFLINHIWKKIYEIFKSPDKALEKYYNEKNDVTNNVTKLEKEIKELNDKLKNIEDWIIKLYVDKLINSNPWIFKKVEDKLNEEKSLIEKELKEKWQKLQIIKDLEYNLNNLNKLKEYYNKKIESIDEEKKIEIIKELVDYIKIHKNWKVTIWFKFEEKDDDEDDWNWKRPDEAPKPFMNKDFLLEQKVNELTNNTK